jgi:hypothetical protein
VPGSHDFLCLVVRIHLALFSYHFKLVLLTKCLLLILLQFIVRALLLKNLTLSHTGEGCICEEFTKECIPRPVKEAV